MIVHSKHDPFGIERELREKYGDRLVNDCVRYEVDSPVGEFVTIRLHLVLQRDTTEGQTDGEHDEQR